ncbi:hypothetical protein KDL45_11960 [bacterium]|nr:hypothetical protein [bacterium]
MNTRQFWLILALAALAALVSMAACSSGGGDDDDDDDAADDDTADDDDDDDDSADDDTDMTSQEKYGGEWTVAFRCTASEDPDYCEEQVRLVTFTFSGVSAVRVDLGEIAGGGNLIGNEIRYTDIRNSDRTYRESGSFIFFDDDTLNFRSSWDDLDLGDNGICRGNGVRGDQTDAPPEIADPPCVPEG